RERVLTPAELGAIWRGLGDNRYGDIIRLLILTAQRREGIWGLRLSEIGFYRGLFVWPPSRSKNKPKDEVAMWPVGGNHLQRAVGANAKANGGGKGKANANLNDAGVFGERGFSGCWDTHKQSLDRRVALPQPWRLHDLRRTAATMMAEMGVAPWIVEAILNHVS